MKTKRKNIFKSLLALTLALIMVLGVAPLSEFAGVDWASLFAPKAEAAGKTYGIYTYEVGTDGTVTITDCDGSVWGGATIPSQIDGKPVTSIGNWAFQSCIGLTDITIPNSVTSIGDGAFSNCGIKSITIPNGVTSIGDSAFEYCNSLTSITIPNSVTSIGNNAFHDCTGLTSITIPDGVTSIGDREFYNCNSLTSITIPNSVTSIGYEAFYHCNSLTSITIPNSVTSIGDSAFKYCSSLTSITIPNSVTSIGDSAFHDCNSLTSITIPNSVTSIGSNVFDNTGIYNDESNWENDVLYIGNYLIKAKSTLSGEYEIKNRAKCIANSAFFGCTSLTSITIPNGVTSICNYAFKDCSSLTSVTIPNSVTSIGDWAFSGCNSLTSITIPNSVTSIGDSAFWDCSSLTSVTIPDSVTSIGDWAFSDCNSLTSITIPDSVTSIGDSAFYGCNSLTSITIPNSVTSIGDDPFYVCRKLNQINVDTANTAYSSVNGVLFNKEKTKLIRYPEGKTYTSYAIPSSVTNIGDSAFCECYRLTSITIPNSVTSIGDDAFSNCGIKSITIPNGVTSIGSGAFYDCRSLTSITIPDSVTSIGNWAFKYCTGLKDVYYTGSKDDWKAISVGSDNDNLLNATIHYNCTGEHGSTNNDPASSAPFNQPTYIADIWSGNREKKTPEHEQLSWYYNGYKPITRTIVEEMGDTAFKFWDGVKCVSNPANGAEIALKKEKQRELIIFDAIRDVLGSPEFSDIISTSAASDLVGWTKSLNSAAKKIYGAEGIENFDDFYKKYGKNNSNGKKKTKALVEAAYADYQQDVGAVNCLSDLLTCVDSVLKIAKSSKEVINAFVNCMMVARMRESLKAVIDEMYAQSTDSDMRTALSNVKNYCVSEMDALAGTMVRSVAGIGVTVLKEFVGDFWDDLADMVPIAGPIIKGVKIGAAVGEGICNMLFSTGNTRDNYYLAKSTVEFVDIARKASLSLQKKYSANRTTEAANAYIDSVRLYISVLNLDAENGRKFCKTACNDGLINGVANWINGGNAKYDEIERCTNSIQKTNSDFVDLISISWIFADNYLKTDYPEMYDTLCQNILTSPKYASTITQVKVDLSGKATVYFDVPSYAAGFKPVSGVQVQYKKNNGSYSMLADLANPYAKSASHSITLSNSDTYTYRVRTYAKLTTGKIEYSDWSEEYTALANPAETPEIYCRVGAIGVDVRVRNNYFLSTGFNESQSGVVTTVEIYRRRQGESEKKLIGTIISDLDRLNLVTDKNPGTTKCYYSARTVVKYNGKTYYSKYSQEVCTIMSGKIPKDPRLDINIRANSSSPKTRAVTYADAANGFSIELAWDKIDGVSTYEVYRKLDEAKLYVYIGKTDSGNTSFVDNTVSEAGRYDYIIKFYQDIGGEKVLCGESQSASVLVERVAQQTETVEIKKGKTATISINSGNLSDGSTVSWSTSSDCITLTPSEDGTSCEVKANSKGSATVTVTITHADGSTVSDTFEIEAKSKGIFATIFDIILAPFRAIINLFKKLFGK